MTREPWRYLRWWVTDQKDTYLVLASPFLVIIGLFEAGASVLTPDLKVLLTSLAILLAGLFGMLLPVFRYRKEPSPDFSPVEDKGSGPQ